MQSNVFSFVSVKFCHLQPKQSSYNYSEAAIINLTSVQSIDILLLEHGLKECIVDKNKYIKKDIVVEFEIFYSSIDKDILLDDKEIFHVFLRSAKSTFTQNVYETKENTYNLFKPLLRNKDIVLLSSDKDSSVVTFNKVCYKEKIIDWLMMV